MLAFCVHAWAAGKRECFQTSDFSRPMGSLSLQAPSVHDQSIYYWTMAAFNGKSFSGKWMQFAVQAFLWNMKPQAEERSNAGTNHPTSMFAIVKTP